MLFGSVLSEFKEINLKTADDREFKLKNNFLSKIGFKIIGIPHIEMRVRARRIFSFLPKNGNKKKILDAGCGPGIYSLTLLKKNFIVYALDIDKKKLDSFKGEFKKVIVNKGDITSLKFKDKSFDFVLCSDVIEHIEDDRKAISELSRVLKNKGVLIFTFPSCSEKNKKNQKRFGHKRIGYKIEDIKKFAEENNLKIKKIKKYSGKLVEKVFEINEKIYKNKILLGILFYPLYFVSFIEDLFRLNKKHFNGIAVKLIKND